MQWFWHAFIPLFVAFDAAGLLPVFWGLVQRLNPAQRRRALIEAVTTACVAAIIFLFVSRVLLALMGLEFADLMVAGGVILLVLSLRDLVFPDEALKGHYDSPGVVPLGIPLLAGPAVLTTVMLVRDRHGWPVTAVALIANMAAIWVILGSSEWLMRRLGREGTQVISKVANLILTAFGVMLIREGIFGMQGGP